MELTDGRIALRPPTDDDVDWIVEACSDPETQRWLPMLPQPYERADAEWWVDRCARVWAEGSAAPFIVVDVNGGRVGTIEVRFAVPADIGYWLAPAGRGRGVMTQALRLVLRFAFQERQLAQVELYTLIDNVRSQAVAERAGFRPMGRVAGKIESRDGLFYDALRFVLDRPSRSADG